MERRKITMMQSVGIVGLGRMGMPAAKVLLNAGYDVIGYDIRKDALDELISIGGIGVKDYKAMAEKVQTVIVFVLDDAQVIEVVTSHNGLLAGSNENSIIICMSTINKHSLEQTALQCVKSNVGFVDCPCTGGPEGIENGSLIMIAAAPDNLLDKCRPILENMGKIVKVGENPGLGQAVKHCNQLLVATTHAAIMEIFLMAQKGGLNLNRVCEVLGSGSAGSSFFRVTSKSILEKTPHQGKLGQLGKDIDIVINSGRELKIPLLVATAAYQYFLAAESLGFKDEESSELIKVVKRFSEPDK